MSHGEYDEAVGIWRIRSDRLEFAVRLLDPENRRAVWIRACVSDWPIERRADQEEFPVGREHRHGGHTVGLVLRIYRVSLRACRERAFGVDRHQPQMVGAECVQHVKQALRGGIGQAFGGAALSLDGVSRRFDVEPREPPVLANTEARDRIVAAVGREQKLPVRREDDATGAFKGVRRALLATDRLESPGTGAAGEDTFNLGERAFCIATIVDNGILDLVRLHVERSATMIRLTLACSSDFWDPPGNGSPSYRARCHLQKRSTIYARRAFRMHVSVPLGHTYLPFNSVAHRNSPPAAAN